MGLCTSECSESEFDIVSTDDIVIVEVVDSEGIGSLQFPGGVVTEH